MRGKITLMAIVAALLVSSLALAGPKAGAKAGNPVVIIKTSMGTMEAVLYKDKAPISVENFLKYVDAKFYDGTIFHRVIPNFMIQGGGFTSALKRKETRAPIKNEADNGVKNERGTLAMARTTQVNSATAQFFINLKHNSFLDHGGRDFGYAVFGRLTKGQKVLDAIAKVKTGRKGPLPRDVPLETVTIESIRRKSK